MIRPAVRSLLAALVVAVAVGGLAAGPAAAQGEPAPTTSAAPSTGAPETPSGDPAIDDLVGCVQGSRQLLVLFLIDESASLKVTDPDDRRVDAARGALDSLVALASNEGQAAPQVDVALAAFSNEYRPVEDWTPAGPDTADALNEALDQFKSFNNGIDTDFVNALSAGRESLADQAATVTVEGGEPPCRAIVLFTDGGYDLAVRTSEADQERLGTTKTYAPGIELTTKANVERAEAAGRKALCDPGQLADRLRSDNVTLLTVALSGDVARRSQLPLAAATSGTADDYTCGTQPEGDEGARVQGAYLPAEDIDVLVTQFTGVGTRLAGGNLVPGEDQVEICGKDLCEEGTRTFKLDRSLRRAQVLALPPEAGATVTIEGPSGSVTTVSEAGAGKVGATPFDARSIAGRGFAVDLERPADLEDWNGEWKVSITDPTGEQAGDAATLQIFVFSDIGIRFGTLGSLVRGETTEIEAVLALPEGVKAQDVIASSVAQVRLRNAVTGQTDTVELEGPPGGPFVGSYETPADTTSNAMDAVAEVRINTTSAAAITSQSGTTEMLVRRPAGSIQFAPASLNMPSLTGKGSTVTDLVLVGGEEPGCVWFGKASVPEPPDGAGTIKVTGADGEPLATKASCIEVPAGDQVIVTVEAEPSGRASGTVQGNLQVFEQVDGQEAATTTEIPFRFDLARGVDQAQRLLLSVVLMALGLGLPLGALVLLNALTARFQSLDAVRGTAIPVLVSGKSISRVDGSYPRPLNLKADDFGSLAAAGNDRRFTFGGVEFRARASRNPFGATIAMAAPEGGAEKLKGKAGSRVELDPSLAGSWVFLLDSDRTRMAGRGDSEGLLIAFVAEGDIATQTNRMLPDISDRLPATASRLAELVRGTKRKPVKKKKHDTDLPVDPTDVAGAAEPGAPAPSAPETPAGEVVSDPSDGGAPADGPTDGPSDAPAGTGDRTGAGDPANPAAPAAPAGFGGAGASTPVPPVAPTAPEPDPDDGPGGPPVGFGGIGRS